jgi:hypothetical protein
MAKRKQLEAAQRATERFLNKRLRVNQPFQSLIATDEFKHFHSQFQAAIKAQYKELANAVRDSHMVALSSDDLVRQFVDSNMPAIGDYIDKADIVDYLTYCFVEGVRAQYGRLGLKTTASKVSFSFDDAFNFELTNPNLIATLGDEAEYLLHKSAIDGTTRDRLIQLIMDSKLDDNATVDEIAGAITDEMSDISDSRAFTIARTETSRAMGQGNYNAMTQNGVQEKKWVTAGANPCDICIGNEDDDWIPIGDAFSSGDLYEPAHPNDECYTEANEIDLDSVDIWDGS